jgi:hypothetical protein
VAFGCTIVGVKHVFSKDGETFFDVLLLASLTLPTPTAYIFGELHACYSSRVSFHALALQNALPHFLPILPFILVPCCHAITCSAGDSFELEVALTTDADACDTFVVGCVHCGSRKLMILPVLV